MKAHWSYLIATALLLAGCGGAAPAAAPASPSSPLGSGAAKPAAPAAASTSAAASAKPAASGAPAGSASAKPAASGTGKPYTFGVMIPLTGPAANIGANFRRAIDLAVEQINAAGGVDGWTLEPNYQDHRATAQGGTEAMNQLANIAKVPYSVASFSGPTLAAQPVAAQQHILLVNSGATDSNLLNKPWLYNNQAMAPQLMPPLADYAAGEGKRKAAMLVSNDPYGDGSRKAFAPAFQKGGGQIVADETFPLNATDFGAQLTKMKASNPDVLMQVAVGVTQGQLLKQTRALGIQTEVIGPLGTSDTIKLGGDAANGFIDSSIAVDPNTTDPEAKKFLTSFQQKYNVPAEWNDGTVYETVYLLRDLIDEATKAGADPRSGDALLKALQAHPEFHNFIAGGTVKFNAQQSVDRALAIRKVTDGKFQTIKVVTS
jgi:branched-chain amino acid transport system substrate-binding protein